MIDRETGKTAGDVMPRGAGERILFVDDDVRLADLGKQVLNYIGYDTDTCANAELAIELIQANPTAYVLVITDEVMPGMTGTDFAQWLKGMRPDLPIILTTGDTDGLRRDRLQAIGVRQLLAKPLSMHALAMAVHQELSSTLASRNHEGLRS